MTRAVSTGPGRWIRCRSCWRPTSSRRLAAGLAQRATLLDRLLADIYGPRRVIAEGLLPPEVVLGHPGLLRACAGIVPPGGRFLHFYAADLVRTPEGDLRVLADRTQAPAGAGYALENRIVLGRVLPEAFRECHAQRLAPFFRTLRDTLAALAPHGRENPRIVLLTAGPHNATYFEQAFLAQYLGYPLVEGGDLTVRDGRVFLKTLGGLHPVDVILRRLNDDYCDPLELRPESLLGVPGPAAGGARRAGRDRERAGRGRRADPGADAVPAVAVPRAAGRGAAARVGRDLVVRAARDPRARARSPGRDGDQARVSGRGGRDRWRRAVAAQEPGEPIFGARLDSDASEKLAAAMRAAPGRFVAQRRVMPSTVPVIEGDELKPRSLVLRAFVVADGVDGYETMPGALAVVGGAADEIDISIARGARSKDTWVISDGEVSEFSLLRPAAQPVAPTRGGGDLPSRVADNFFWLGRYAERAEAIARLLARHLPAADRSGPARVRRRLRAAGRGAAHADADRFGAQPTRATARPGSRASRIGWCATRCSTRPTMGRCTRRRIRSNGWRVRSAIACRWTAGRSWCRCNTRSATASARAKDERLLTLAARLDRVVMTLTALAGFTSESMTREAAWRFLDMGRRLERALNTAIVLEQALAVVRPDETPVLEALLDTADSAMTYRRRYRATLQVAPVVDLLAADEGNPRSILFQLAALAEHVAALPHDPTLARRSAEERIAFEALSAFRLLDVDVVCADERGLAPGARRAVRRPRRQHAAPVRRAVGELPRARDRVAIARVAGDGRVSYRVIVSLAPRSGERVGERGLRT